MSRDTIQVIGEYDWSGGCYEWSAAQLGKDENNTCFIRAGSGCSCDSIGDESWEPLRDMNQVHSMVDNLSEENSDIPLKAALISRAQELIGGK